MILTVVHLVLGPITTTLIFNPVKGWRLLTMDLVIIGTVQIAALLYGMFIIFGGRPAYVVFNVDRFDAVAAVELDEKSLGRAMARGEPGPSWWGPQVVAARLPTDDEQRWNLLTSSLAGGADLPQLPEYFVPLQSEKAAILEQASPLSELKALNNMSDKAWQEFLASLGAKEAYLGYLPLKANARDGVVVVSKESGEVVKICLLIPRWDTGAKKAKPASRPEGQKPGAPKRTPSSHAVG